jgi:excisionase family DNA binding protein
LAAAIAIMEPTGISELITTTEAAALLGVSRQHVVNLCERGVLTYIKAGAHRRLRRVDLDALTRPKLTRDQERTLWLHHLVAARLVIHPAETIDKARQNLHTMRQAHAAGTASRWIDSWQNILDEGPDRILDILVSRSPEAVELRQNSPFAGVLPVDERQAALAAFRSHWRREHAA